MKTGIQYQEKMRMNEIREAGFSWIELTYSQMNRQDFHEIEETVSGIVISAEDFLTDKFEKVIDLAADMKAAYIVIDTVNFDDVDKMDFFVEQNLELLRQKEISIYLENGFKSAGKNSYQCSSYSEIYFLKALVDKYNQLCQKERFGLCLNVGYANLLGKNMRAFVEEAGKMLGLVHMNDNDGLHNDQQMPLTFTKGRGTRTTDIFRLIGALNRIKYDGWMIFDTKGLFERSPACLHQGFLRLLHRLSDEWEDQFLLEKKLDQPGKQLILFGTGKMAYNYVCEWGWKYPPAFMVDNNAALWGKKRFDIPVKKPEDILAVPEDERNVFICNQYYSAVGDQLTKMGIAYQCYNDNYYM